MNYFLYILKSKISLKSYTGITNDLDRRLLEHNSGKHFYTKRHCPWIMIYNEKYVSNGINSINTIEFPPEFIPDKIVGITDNNIAKLIAENQNFITPLLKNLITKIKTLTPKEKLYIEYYLAWNTVIKQKLIDAISIHLNKRNIIIKV